MMVFENTTYYEDGSIETYSFCDEENPNYYYERFYNRFGKVDTTIGEVFFQGYTTGIEDYTLNAKEGDEIRFDIFYPNPPDCTTTLSVTLPDGTRGQVFYPDKYINDLSYTCSTAKRTKYSRFKIDAWLTMVEPNGKDTSFYNKTVFYKVVKR